MKRFGIEERIKPPAYVSIFILFGLLVVSFLMIGCSSGSDAPPAQANTAVAPEQITADPGNARVTLNWMPVSGATAYNVYYSTTPGVTAANAPYRIADQSPPIIIRFLPGDITPLSDKTTYYLAVTSSNGSGESPVSKEVSATPFPSSSTPPPVAPVQLRAESQTGQITLSWEASSSATSYRIYYKTSPGVTKANGTGVDVPVAGGTSHVVASLANNTIYYFMVTASNANGESGPSFEVSAVPLPSPPPSHPTSVTAQEGNQQIIVSWPTVSGATSYHIYYAEDNRNVDKTTGVKIANVASPFTMIPLANNQAYCIVVTAANASGESAESAVVSATPVSISDENPRFNKMVSVSGGTFTMGDDDDIVENNEGIDTAIYYKPAHTVTVNTFWIDKYETKYDLWKEVYDWAVANGYRFDNPGKMGSYNIGTNMPVTYIHWYDVTKWLNARSEKEGRTPVYYTDAGLTTVYRTGQVDVENTWVKWDANGYRLPTEAEWEYAARGGLEGNTYPWGNDPVTGKKTNSNKGTAVSVGCYPPNGYGLYDMAGNIFEWVWDWSSAGYSWAGASINNPHGPDAPDMSTSGPGKTRVRRGGGFTYGERYHKVYERMFRVPTYTAVYFGFRSARNVDPAP
jgi:formylglycine-generating enzyme required for sulfatase activity